jgi:hypothetical protein
MALHRDAVVGDRHSPYFWEHADATEREAETIAAADLYKVSIQDNDFSTWIAIATGSGADKWHRTGSDSNFVVSGPTVPRTFTFPDSNATVHTNLTKSDVLQAAIIGGADSGAADAYEVGFTPAITALVEGAKYRFQAANANTGASTLDLQGLGAEAIKKLAGGITTALAANDIRADQWVEVVWDGTNFQMVSQVGNVATPSTTPVCIQIACSDETTALTVGDGKVVFRAPYAFTLTAVRASVTTAPTGGTLLTIDITEAGTTVLSTLLTFDASEKTTVTAATPAVISDSAIADDAEISINIDAVGSTIAGAGLKVTLIGTKP